MVNFAEFQRAVAEVVINVLTQLGLQCFTHDQTYLVGCAADAQVTVIGDTVFWFKFICFVIHILIIAQSKRVH